MTTIIDLPVEIITHIFVYYVAHHGWLDLMSRLYAAMNARGAFSPLVMWIAHSDRVMQVAWALYIPPTEGTGGFWPTRAQEERKEFEWYRWFLARCTRSLQFYQKIIADFSRYPLDGHTEKALSYALQGRQHRKSRRPNWLDRERFETNKRRTRWMMGGMLPTTVGPKFNQHWPVGKRQVDVLTELYLGHELKPCLTKETLENARTHQDLVCQLIELRYAEKQKACACACARRTTRGGTCLYALLKGHCVVCMQRKETDKSSGMQRTDVQRDGSMH